MPRQDINFYMPANQMGLLYGRSGAGKTTLLNVLSGLTEPTTGHIQVASTCRPARRRAVPDAPPSPPPPR